MPNKKKIKIRLKDKGFMDITKKKTWVDHYLFLFPPLKTTTATFQISGAVKGEVGVRLFIERKTNQKPSEKQAKRELMALLTEMIVSLSEEVNN